MKDVAHLVAHSTCMHKVGYSNPSCHKVVETGFGSSTDGKRSVAYTNVKGSTRLQLNGCPLLQLCQVWFSYDKKHIWGCCHVGVAFKNCCLGDVSIWLSNAQEGT